MSKKAAAGRPKDMEKRGAIITAARELFFANGLGATSIEEIARAAGVSKVTVYGHFGDKTGILEAVVGAQAEEMEQAISLPENSGTEQMLCRFGTVMGGFILSDEVVGCDSTLAQEAARHSDLRQRFFAAGPLRMRRLLEAIIGRGVERGDLDVPDITEAAHHFFGMILGFRSRERRFGLVPAFPPAEIERVAADAARRFMRAYAPD